MAALGTLYYDSGSVAGDSDIESVECPLCCQELDLTDRSIQYCECGCKFWILTALRSDCSLSLYSQRAVLSILLLMHTIQPF